MPAPSWIGRRTLLAAAGALPVLAACGTDDSTDTASTATASTDDREQPMTERLTYGDDRSQWADLRRPEGTSRGVVVIIHGGFWKAEYDASLGEPLAADLTARGWTTLNVEYRRVGNGGGFPHTFDDVHAAIEALAGHRRRHDHRGHARPLGRRAPGDLGGGPRAVRGAGRPRSR